MAAIGLAGLVIGTVDAVFVRNRSALRRLRDRWRIADPTSDSLVLFLKIALDLVSNWVSFKSEWLPEYR